MQYVLRVVMLQWNHIFVGISYKLAVITVFGKRAKIVFDRPCFITSVPTMLI